MLLHKQEALRFRPIVELSLSSYGELSAENRVNLARFEAVLLCRTELTKTGFNME